MMVKADRSTAPCPPCRRPPVFTAVLSVCWPICPGMESGFACDCTGSVRIGSSILDTAGNSIKWLGRPVGRSRQQTSSDASWYARFLLAKLRPVLRSVQPPSLDAASPFLPGRHSVLAVVRSRVRPETGFPLRPPARRRFSGTPPFSPAVVRVGELRAVVGR